MNYAVVYKDQAIADRERLYLSYFMGSPEYAQTWISGLASRIQSLREFPGPMAWAVDEAASALYGREVRRILYYGPTRRSSVATRILFTLLPPNPEEAESEQPVVILRILHGSQSLDTDTPASE